MNRFDRLAFIGWLWITATSFSTAFIPTQTMLRLCRELASETSEGGAVFAILISFVTPAACVAFLQSIRSKTIPKNAAYVITAAGVLLFLFSPSYPREGYISGIYIASLGIGILLSPPATLRLASAWIMLIIVGISILGHLRVFGLFIIPALLVTIHSWRNRCVSP